VGAMAPPNLWWKINSFVKRCNPAHVRICVHANEASKPKRPPPSVPIAIHFSILSLFPPSWRIVGLPPPSLRLRVYHRCPASVPRQVCNAPGHWASNTSVFQDTRQGSRPTASSLALAGLPYSVFCLVLLYPLI
jgi:hypothetical protein